MPGCTTAIRSGGVDFDEDTDPDWWDFAYRAFTVGMTYQVSDTDPTNKPMRRTVLRHALLSFLFGTFIVAITIKRRGRPPEGRAAGRR
jgi:uncharacterized membrane protein